MFLAALIVGPSDRMADGFCGVDVVRDSTQEGSYRSNPLLFFMDVPMSTKISRLSRPFIEIMDHLYFFLLRCPNRSSNDQ